MPLQNTKNDFRIKYQICKNIFDILCGGDIIYAANPIQSTNNKISTKNKMRIYNFTCERF